MRPALFATGARSPEEREASGGVALGAKPPASNGRFAGGKGTLREGGVRLPAIMNWPAKLKPAAVNEPLHHVDVMPTLLALAGGRGDPAKPFDGKNAWATKTLKNCPRSRPHCRRGYMTSWSRTLSHASCKDSVPNANTRLHAKAYVVPFRTPRPSALSIPRGNC